MGFKESDVWGNWRRSYRVKVEVGIFIFFFCRFGGIGVMVKFFFIWDSRRGSVCRFRGVFRISCRRGFFRGLSVICRWRGCGFVCGEG